MLDFAIESEGGTLEILQISGGEPLLHPDLDQLLQIARSKKVQTILLNTNGLELSSRPDLVKKLAAFQNGFEVYLQFDGVTNAAHQALRGQPLLERKLKALDLLSQNRVPTTLVASIAAGINENEIGPIIVKALQTPSVRGVSFQPIAYFGRIPGKQVRRLDRMTITGVMHRLENQMKQMMRCEHFIPLPCDVDRVAIAYFQKNDDGAFSPVVTRQEAKSWLNNIRNTLRFSPEEFTAVRSAASCCGTDCCGGFAAKIMNLFPRSFFNETSAAEKSRMISERTFRVTITSFVDAYNFELRSMQRECVHVITPDLKKIPFSAYNICHRNTYSQ